MLAASTLLFFATVVYAADENYPVIFSTYVGGSSVDRVRDVEIDNQGNIYITGGTTSADFVTTPGAYDTTHNGNFDIFLVKYDKSGNLLWSTLIGGPNHDRAYAVEADPAGNVYVAGRAGRNFPTTPGVLQEVFAGDINPNPVYGPQDGFVCKLNADGVLQFCTYFGSPDKEFIRDMDVDPNGNIYVASAHELDRFPPAIDGAFLNTKSGRQDAVIARITGDGKQVLWARYIGGNGQESNENTIRVDSEGNPVILLMTDSSNIATPGAYDENYSGNKDLYVTKFDSAGNVIWGTYIGGSKREEIETHQLATDASGNVFVAATTKSSDDEFLSTPETLVQRYGVTGKSDIFVAKVSPDGSRLVALTFIGGSGDELPEGIGIDSLGQIYLTGRTASNDFPVTADAVQPALLSQDAFFVKLGPNLDRIFASFVGGTGDDMGRALDVASLGGNTVFAGVTRSDDWPTLNGAQIARAGNDDGFLVNIAGTTNGDTPPGSTPGNEAPPDSTAAGSTNNSGGGGGGCVLKQGGSKDLFFPFILLLGAGYLARKWLKNPLPD